jgi:hypothetical protein
LLITCLVSTIFASPQATTLSEPEKYDDAETYKDSHELQASSAQACFDQASQLDPALLPSVDYVLARAVAGAGANVYIVGHTQPCVLADRKNLRTGTS